jgi:PleD family two-component response regulator
MTSRILIVGPASSMAPFEAKLRAEYFDVVCAHNGEQALACIASDNPDMVLAVADMGGYGLCHCIRTASTNRRLPVLLIAERPGDCERGLECGADDFLVLPITTTALFARVRSLLRLRMMQDEVEQCQHAAIAAGIADSYDSEDDYDWPAFIHLVDDQPQSVSWFRSCVEPQHHVWCIDTQIEPAALSSLRSHAISPDLIVISLALSTFDALRFSVELRGLRETRNIPILVLAKESHRAQIARALELGVSDFVMASAPSCEVLARVRTQVRKKRYTDELQQIIQCGVQIAAAHQVTNAASYRASDRGNTSGPNSPFPTPPIPAPVRPASEAGRGFAGFVTGFVAGMLMELLYFFLVGSGTGTQSATADLFIFPIASGLATAGLFREFDLGPFFDRASFGISRRLPTAIYGSWLLLWLTYLAVAKTNPSEWYDENSVRFWTALFVPPTVAVAAIILFRWANSTNSYHVISGSVSGSKQNQRPTSE